MKGDVQVLKKRLVLFLALLLAFMPSITDVSAHSGNLDGSKNTVEVYIDGVKQSYDQPPIIEDGRVLVPFRGVFEALGVTVQWDQKTQMIITDRNGHRMQAVPDKIVNGRALVKLRHVSEVYGATVDYDSVNRIVKITSNL